MIGDQGLREVTIDQFGGLVTLVPRLDLDLPASPGARNVEYGPSTVKSRGGTSKVLQGTTSSEVNGMDSLQIAPGRRLMVTQADGTLWNEVTEGTLTSIDTLLYIRSDAVRHLWRSYSSVLFGRIHIAATASDGFGGIEPSTWDGTYRDRFTYGAPGFAPVVSANAAGGSMTGGYIGVAVCNVMRSGYVTPPTYGNVFNNAGPNKLDVAIGLGPPATVARMIFISIVNPGGANGPYDSTQFFHVPGVMYIADNTTTSVTAIDFTDDQLLTGAQLSGFKGYDAISDPTQILYYSGRSVAVGEVPVIRSRDNARIFSTAITPEAPQALNLRFDAGPDTGGTPYAWAVVGGSPNGAFGAADGAVNPVWAITSDGATADQGHIRNGVSVGASVLEAAIALNQEIGVRVRLRRSPGAVMGDTGVMTFALRDTNGTPVFNFTFDVNVTDIGVGWYTFTKTLGTLTTYGDNLAFDAWMSAPANNGRIVYFGGVEFYRTGDYNQNAGGNPVLRVSRADDSQTFDSTLGFVGVGVGDGQGAGGAFVQGSTLYVAKTRSLWAVVDDGVNEPGNWLVSKVSDVVGCYTPRAIGSGDGWNAILSRNGLYRFAGGSLDELTREIQPLWNAIKWKYAPFFWCVVDEQQKKLRCGVMTGTDAGLPVIDTVFTLDYTMGFGPTQRKWSRDTGTIAGTAACLADRSDGSRRAFFGQTDGGIYQYEPDGHNDGDDDAAIDSYYPTAAFGAKVGIPRIGSIHFLQVSGAGVLRVTKIAIDDTEEIIWEPTLVTPPQRQLSCGLMGVKRERTSFAWGTNAPGFYWEMGAFMVKVGMAPFRQTRDTTP